MTLTVQGQVFFFSSVVLSFPNSLCILDLSWPSSGSEEGLDWRASLEFVLGSFCWRSIRTDWTANGRKRTNFPHLLFFFPDGDLFHYQQIKDNYLFFYFYFFSKNFSKHSLTRTAILIGFHRKKKRNICCAIGLYVVYLGFTLLKPKEKNWDLKCWDLTFWLKRKHILFHFILFVINQCNSPVVIHLKIQCVFKRVFTVVVASFSAANLFLLKRWSIDFIRLIARE